MKQLSLSLTSVESTEYSSILKSKRSELSNYRYYLGFLLTSKVVTQLISKSDYTFDVGVYVKTYKEAYDLLIESYDKSCTIGLVIDRLTERIVLVQNKIGRQSSL